jgi:hypothetical protein
MKSDIPVLDKLEVTAQFIEEAPRLGMSQTRSDKVRRTSKYSAAKERLVRRN